MLISVQIDYFQKWFFYNSNFLISATGSMKDFVRIKSFLNLEKLL